MLVSRKKVNQACNVSNNQTTYPRKKFRNESGSEMDNTISPPPSCTSFPNSEELKMNSKANKNSLPNGKSNQIPTSLISSSVPLSTRKLALNEDICAACGKKDINVEESFIEWIGCDSCDKWYHISCTDLPKNLDAKDRRAMKYDCKNCILKKSKSR